MRKVVQEVMNRYSRWRINRLVPDAVSDLEAYAQRSNTTGTQWYTLWLVVRSILRHKHQNILECGTGSSTIILAATVQKLMREDTSYHGKVVSMESVAAWYEIAQKNLPAKYADVVEIVLGPRERFDVAMFRGYTHSNIPQNDYDFILIDGPAFQDDEGIAFCSDLFRVMQLTAKDVIYGVSDGRASTVMVIQQLFGVATARYWHGFYAADFCVPNVDCREPFLRTPQHFATSVFGRLEFTKFRK